MWDLGSDTKGVLSLMQNPELGSTFVLNQWENEGKNLTKREHCRVVKELKKYKRQET